MESIVRRIVKVPVFIAVFLLVLALMGFIVMSLWNWLLPALFGFKMIAYWQAVGLIVLCKLLFGGFRGPRGGGRWRGRARDNWQQMTPEEREKFRTRMRACGGGAPAEPSESKPGVQGA